MNINVRRLYLNILVNRTAYALRDEAYCYLSLGHWYESVRMKELLR